MLACASGPFQPVALLLLSLVSFGNLVVKAPLADVLHGGRVFLCKVAEVVTLFVVAVSSFGPSFGPHSVTSRLDAAVPIVVYVNLAVLYAMLAYMGYDTLVDLRNLAW